MRLNRSLQGLFGGVGIAFWAASFFILAAVAPLPEAGAQSSLAAEFGYTWTQSREDRQPGGNGGGSAEPESGGRLEKGGGMARTAVRRVRNATMWWRRLEGVLASAETNDRLAVWVRARGAIGGAAAPTVHAMRALTLADPEVLEILESDEFSWGWGEIEEPALPRKAAVADSDDAQATFNGVGPRDFQVFFLTSDGIVLHAVAGFWHPEDFLHEIECARRMRKLWQDEKRDLAEKKAVFKGLHDIEIDLYRPKTEWRSRWPGAAALVERQRCKADPTRDTIVRDEHGEPTKNLLGQIALEPTHIILHRRMGKRPLLPFAEFDVDTFVDYGMPPAGLED